MVGTEHFDPWGNPTYTPSGTTTPFGYQGALGSWTDPTTTFVSMGARWYYPKVSEFLSADPAAGTASPRTPVDRSRWLYGANDPLTRVDPSGLDSGSLDPGAAGDCLQVCISTYLNAVADYHEANQQQIMEQSVHNETTKYLTVNIGGLKVRLIGDQTVDVQNLLVSVGQSLPDSVRQQYVRAMRVAMYVDAGATDRITGDLQSVIDAAGANATDLGTAVSDASQGDWNGAGSAVGRVGQRNGDAVMSMAQGISQMNPATMSMNAAMYGANLDRTYQTRGFDAAIDQASYDFGYQVIGGGTEAMFATGVTMGFAEFIGAIAGPVEGGAVTAPEASTITTEEAYAQLRAMGLRPVGGGAPDAFETAAAGGRHAGFLANYLGRTPEELNAGVQSFGKQIAYHQAKIADPGSYIGDWESLDPRAQAGLIDKWGNDIIRLQDQQFILQELLGGRTP